MDCAVNFLPRITVNLHVVFFATVLLDLGHNLRLAIAADLPFTVLRANVRAAGTYFLVALTDKAAAAFHWFAIYLRAVAFPGSHREQTGPMAESPNRPTSGAR